MTLYEKALKIATEAHEGQVDKGGQPYILHPIEVAKSFSDEIYAATALLHDVIEDTNISLSDLSKLGIPKAVIDAVDALTKRPEEEYVQYLNRVKSNPISRDVKLSDLAHNMQLCRLSHPTKEDLDRIKKYQDAVEYLYG